MSVSHLGQLPSVTLSFDLQPNVALSEAVDLIQKRRWSSRCRHAEHQIHGYGAGVSSFAPRHGHPAGAFHSGDLPGARHSVRELHTPAHDSSGLPTAGLGALVTLWAFNIELNMYAFVGIIMLVGIVKKNAIMMIDFAIEAQRREGKPPSEAIYQACLIRFRPIMMTTFAALMGSLPIALSFGAGGDARRPLGLAVVGAWCCRSLTLYITP